MSEKLVSICIPTFNGGNFIRETLEAIKAQTYKNIEVIITDDCSKDDTAAIAQEYDFVRFFANEERHGLVGNWNNAVSKASGDYIKLMGQDDILAPRSIELQVKALEGHPDASLCIGTTNVINQESKVIMTRRLSSKDFCMNGKKFALKSLWHRNIYCEPANALYTRAAYEKAGEYNKDFIYVPDWDYVIELSLLGDICYIADTVMSFRISNNSETSYLYRKKSYEMLKDTEKMFDKYKERLNLSLFRELFFKLAIRLRMHARLLFIKFKK